MTFIGTNHSDKERITWCIESVYITINTDTCYNDYYSDKYRKTVHIKNDGIKEIVFSTLHNYDGVRHGSITLLGGSSNTIYYSPTQ